MKQATEANIKCANLHYFLLPQPTDRMKHAEN